MFILKGKLSNRDKRLLNQENVHLEHLVVLDVLGLSQMFFCAALVFQTLWCKAFALIEKAVVIHGFCSGLSLFSFIMKPSGKNLVGLQLYVCSGHILLVCLLSSFLHVKFQVLVYFFFGQ